MDCGLSHIMRSAGIVILAAGASTRLGRPKQRLHFQGRSLLRRAIETALPSSAQTIMVVLGAGAAELREEAAGLPVEIVENPDWSQGMGSSLRAGLTALRERRPELTAVLFMVCDQPLVSTDLLNRLLDLHANSVTKIAAAEYGGGIGVPALFPHPFFDELSTLPDSAGAREILRRHRSEVIAVPFPEGEIDIDTETDYARLSEVG